MKASVREAINAAAKSKAANVPFRAPSTRQLAPKSTSRNIDFASNSNHPFRWSNNAEKSARLLAKDTPLLFVHQETRVPLTTLEKWCGHVEFRVRVRQYKEEYAENVLTSGIAVRANRVAAQNKRWQAAQQLQDERAKACAANPELQSIPGATTGLIDPQTKKFDDGIFNAQASVEKHAAIEMGQWNENNTTPTKIEIVYVDKQLVMPQDRMTTVKVTEVIPPSHTALEAANSVSA